MNVVFSNGWIADEDGKVFIYYASSDTRMHVATSTIDKLVDYCMNTPSDGFATGKSVETIKKLIAKNKEMNIVERSVDNYFTRIYEKTGCKNHEDFIRKFGE